MTKDLLFAEELRAQLLNAARRRSRGRKMESHTRTRGALAFGAGLGVALGIAVALWSMPSAEHRATAPPERPGEGLSTNPGPLPDVDIQKEGPLFDGKQISLEEARKLVPYAVPEPVENALTGKLTGIWIDATGQIAFVWDTNLRVYLYGADKTQAEIAADFADKVQNDTDVEEPWVLTDVKGHTALGVEGVGEVPSSLSFQAGGVVFEFVGPGQTLTELTRLAEDLSSS
ncbi:MAG: hypothetical protein WD096_09885 [Actinomycetota bacterium]